MKLFYSKEKKIIDFFYKILKDQNKEHLPIVDQVLHASFKYFQNQGFDGDHLEILVKRVLYKADDYKIAALNLLLAYDFKNKKNSSLPFEKEITLYRKRMNIIDELHKKYFGV